MVPIIWAGFLVLILALVLLDLGVLHRKSREISVTHALTWTAGWITLALAFNIFIYFLYDENWLGWTDVRSHDLSGQEAVAQFFTGYVLEKSLSVDNIFVIAMIFSYFRVPLALQHRVLYWGILGAVLLRGIMIWLGTLLIERFDWIVYLFGLLLIFSAIRMLVIRHDNLQPERNPMVRIARKLFPVTHEFHGNRFFVKLDGVKTATPLFLALILVESGDIIFAIDSIPAIFAVTRDPFLIFTSNVFAILGLRSLYFAIAGLMDRFRYLKTSLVFLLTYIGVKMMLSHHVPIPTGASLTIIGAILSVGVIASIFDGGRDPAPLASPLTDSRIAVIAASYRQAQRVIMIVICATILTAAILMIIRPGPGLEVMPFGLGLIVIEFIWARRWLARISERS